MKNCIILPVGGLGNRIRIILCTLDQIPNDYKKYIWWYIDQYSCEMTFYDIFDNVDGVTVIDHAPWEFMCDMRIKSCQHLSIDPFSSCTHLINPKQIGHIEDTVVVEGHMIASADTNKFYKLMRKFKFKQELCNVVNEFKVNWKHCAGIHIRRTDATWINNVCSMEQYVNGVDELLKVYDKVFLSTDLEEAQNIILDKFGNRIVYHNKEFVEGKTNRSSGHIHDAVIDLIALSKCNILAGHDSSSFLQIAQWTSGASVININNPNFSEAISKCACELVGFGTYEAGALLTHKIFHETNNVNYADIHTYVDSPSTYSSWTDTSTLHQIPGTAREQHQIDKYAFKYIIADQLHESGYDIILYIDTRFQIVDNLTPMINRIRNDGYLIVQNNYCVLGAWCNDFVLERFGVSRDEVMSATHVMGGIWGINLRTDIGKQILNKMLDEIKAGSFRGEYNNNNMTESQDKRCNGHRHDEAVLGLIAHQMKLKITNLKDIAYSSLTAFRSWPIRVRCKTQSDIVDNKQFLIALSKAHEVYVVSDNTDVLVPSGIQVMDPTKSDNTILPRQSEKITLDVHQPYFGLIADSPELSNFA